MSFLPKYVFAENNSLHGAGLIIGTHEPFFYANVIKSITKADFEKLASGHSGKTCHAVPHYAINIVLTGTFITVPNDFYIRNESMIKNICAEMAEFYFYDRIESKPSAFSRFKLKG